MEVLEDIKDKKIPVPAIVSVLAILNYLILGIIILGGIYNLGQLIRRRYAFGHLYIYDDYNVRVISISVVVVFLLISFYGVVLMHKGRKKGFYFYLPAIGIIGIFALYALFSSKIRLVAPDEMATFIIAAVAFLFILIFATQLKKLS